MLGFLEGCFVPSLRAHAFVDKALFGKSYYKIHRRLDDPVKLLGRGHRVLFHDFPSACLIAQKCYPGDPNAVRVACAHIVLDQECSADPEFKAQLEELAIQSSKNRKGKQTKTQMPDEDSILRDLEKLVDIERLFKLLRS